MRKSRHSGRRGLVAQGFAGEDLGHCAAGSDVCFRLLRRINSAGAGEIRLGGYREDAMWWILVVAMLLWPALAAAQSVRMGEQVFARCAMCHEIGAGAKSRQGPLLTGLFGRRAASVPDFPYSAAMRQDRDNGLIWTPETVAGFIAKPKHFEPGTGMIFPGLKNEADIADVVAYIATFQSNEAIELQLGGSLLEVHCSGCHAIGAEGASAHPEAPPFRTLHERYDVGDLEEALVEGLVSGHPDMPEYTFAPEEAVAIVRYLRSLE